MTISAASLVSRLFDHLEWADARILEALRAAAARPPKAIQLYGHVLGAEHVWVSRIRGEAATIAVWPELTLDDCAAVAAENVAGLRAVADRDLEAVVAYTNSAGLAFESTLGDILVHVAMHGQYHRGQVNLLLRDAGEKPAPVDFIAFTRGMAAATR